jgi:hypothetical protein
LNYYTKGWSQPASVIAWGVAPLVALFGAAYAIGGYAILVKKYNILWAAGPFVPGWIYFFHNYAH